MRATRTPYLYERGRKYYFRYVFSAEFPESIRGREFKISLKTTDRNVAIQLTARLSAFIGELIQMAEVLKPLTPKDVRSMLRTYFEREMLEVANNVDFGVIFPGLDVDYEIKDAKEQLPILRHMAGRQEFDEETKKIADELIDEFSFKPPLSISDSWTELRRGVLRARIETLRIYVALLEGQYGEICPQDKLFEGCEIYFGSELESDDKPEPVTLGAAIAEFAKLKSSVWAPKTRLDHQRVLRWLTEIVGAKTQIEEISLSQMKEFRSVLLDMPRNLAKKTELAGLPLKKAIAKCQDEEKLSAKTVKKYWDMAASFWDWCVAESLVTVSPAKGLKVAVKSNPQEARFPFKHQQLEKLFNSPIFTGCRSKSRRAMPGNLVIRDGKYWAFLVAAYSGMRIGEIAGLRRADIAEHSGVWVFDITESGEPSKQLKSKAAQRKVPIHSALRAVGFLGWVSEKTGDDPNLPLFPDLCSSKSTHASHAASKSLNRYLEQVGVKGPKQSFHSFRHNFKEALDAKGLPEGRIGILLGHSQTSTTAIYGSGISLEVKAKDVELVDYGLDLSHLIESSNQLG